MYKLTNSSRRIRRDRTAVGIHGDSEIPRPSDDDLNLRLATEQPSGEGSSREALHDEQPSEHWVG